MSYSSAPVPPSPCSTFLSKEILDMFLTSYPFIFSRFCPSCNNNHTSMKRLIFYQCVCSRRCDGSKRESDREKENEIKGEYDRQCGIFDFLASTNPFSLRLGPFFSFTTSTTISDNVISYTRL